MEDKTKVSIEIDNGFFEMKVEKKSETNAPTHVKIQENFRKIARFTS